MATGLFFGTFNPFHRGHEAMVYSFLSSGTISELWIVPTPSPPHKDQAEIAPFRDRWNMVELAVSGIKGVRLSDIERHISAPHYTLKTIAALAGRYPDHGFVLCIGSDTLQTMPSWYKYKKISGYISLLVAARPGIPKDPPEALDEFTIHYCKHDMVDVSSTEIRNEIAEGNIPGSGMISPEIAAYIRNNNLYRS